MFIVFHIYGGRGQAPRKKLNRCKVIKIFPKNRCLHPSESHFLLILQQFLLILKVESVFSLGVM